MGKGGKWRLRKGYILRWWLFLGIRGEGRENSLVYDIWWCVNVWYVLLYLYSVFRLKKLNRIWGSLKISYTFFKFYSYLFLFFKKNLKIDINSHMCTTCWNVRFLYLSHFLILLLFKNHLWITVLKINTFTSNNLNVIFLRIIATKELKFIGSGQNTELRPFCGRSSVFFA